MSRAVTQISREQSVPCGLAFQLGVVHRKAEILAERAALWAKLLELEVKSAEVREGVQRLLAEAMTLHAEVESCIKMAEELE